MDYLGYKCPVCDKYFHANDDIVVCPDCGTPHHRACYEQEGKCKNTDLHEQGYDFSEENTAQAPTGVVCPKCGEKCSTDAFFCKHCGTPLSSDAQRTESSQQNQGGFAGGKFPMGMDPAMFDPMGGVEQDFDMGDGVTAGEAAKYVKQNTPYFVRIFRNIRTMSRSKFNFAAALFTGGYLLYRKMYKLGAIITAIQVATLLFVTYLYNSSSFVNLYSHVTTLYSSAGGYTEGAMAMMEYMATLTPFENFLLFLPAIYELLQVIAMITIGACANRLYFSHCKKQIVAIKSQSADIAEAETKLQTKGGVNIALAVSLLVTYMLINYLPSIIISMF